MDSFDTRAPGSVSLTYRSRENPLYSQLLLAIGNADAFPLSPSLSFSLICWHPLMYSRAASHHTYKHIRSMCVKHVGQTEDAA